MMDGPSDSRFKPEMPQIPGVTVVASRRPVSHAILPVLAAVLAFGLVIVVAVRWFARPHVTVPAAQPEPPAQLDVPAPPPDPASLLPHADRQNPVIAKVSDLAKPWSSQDFFIRNFDGQEIPATILRLPSGSANSESGYWAFSRKSLYGSCLLEFIPDLAKLRDDYGLRDASHPLVGDPCSHTLYDPLRTFNLPGNVWIRGAMVRGSDLRPPLGVEIEIRGKQILAIRTE